MNKRTSSIVAVIMVFLCTFFNTRVYASEQVKNVNTLETIPMDASLQNNKDNEEKNLDISEAPKEPQEDKTDASEAEKIVQARRILVDSINVINTGETNYVNIKQSPSLKSRIIGKIYGDLTAIRIIGRSGSYTYIEAMDYKTDRLVKGYVLPSQIKTRILKKQYQVIVDISDQMVYVYNYEKLERVMACSTGKANTITPVGMYLIGKRGNSFYSRNYKQGGYNWVRFNYNFLFHSVPFDKNRTLILSEAQKLGQQASHGCIRLSMEDSKWFYQTITEGTLVVVQL